ncbi:MAG: aldo/keto reductase [Cyclobacteriaceae bacterium]
MNELYFSDGSSIPQLGLGTWKSDTGVVGNAVTEALKSGYRHIDCAAIYGNEKEIGTALKNAFSEKIADRNEVFVTSKLWNTMHHPDDVEKALKTTLDDLGLEYLDLYLMHWPIALKREAQFPFGPDDFIAPDELPYTETWKAMEKLKEKGLARHIGVSNFSISNLSKLIRSCNIKPEMNQVEMHPFLPQKELFHFCSDHDILMTAYSPLGSSDRSERLKAENEPSLLENSIVHDIADDAGCSPAQVLLAWALQRGTCVIPKSTNPGRIKQNFNAQKVELSDEMVRTLDHLDVNFRFVSGSFWAKDGSPYTLDFLWN